MERVDEVQLLDAAAVGARDEEELRVGRPRHVRPGLAVGQRDLSLGLLLLLLTPEPAGSAAALAPVAGATVGERVGRWLQEAVIGPFAGRHTIDFAELTAGGLFLLEGPTGAGKSTLIDAVVFALYGTVASAQASDERLRAAAADPDTESFVDLVFEVPAGPLIAAVMNAIADAIPGGAGAHLDMPATPEKIWQACRNVEQK